MSKKEIKTNAVRNLDTLKIPYDMITYVCDEFTDGIHVADLLGISHNIMYKTIVTIGKSGGHYVFVIPIESEIDFKKAAKVVDEKSLEMLPLKALTSVTGYVRGGCTCIGMKKRFPTVIQADAKRLPQIAVSGGKLGMQLMLRPEDLRTAANGIYADVIPTVVNTIFLDIDGTLLDFDIYEEVAFRHACDMHHIPFTDKLYTHYHMVNRRLWKRHEMDEVTREELIYMRFQQLFQECNIVCDEYSFEDVYQQELAEGCHYIDGAIELLEYLKQKKYELYYVTNGLYETQVKKLRTSKLHMYANNIFISEEVGYQKPKKEYFEECFGQIPDFERAKALIVGDSLSSDIKGGNNAGIRTCWYNPKQERNDGQAHVDYEINCLAELKTLL